MATKKKVDDEAGDTAEVVDTEAVETPGDDAPAEVIDLEGDQVPNGEDGIPVLSESTPVEEPVEEQSWDALKTAQAIIGLPTSGRLDHATKMALRKFQQQNGLSPSGRLDAATRGKLGI